MPGGGARAAVLSRAAEQHRRAFGAEPTALAVAPGRINIIGEHTDYAGGLCLPAAVDRYLALAVSSGSGIQMVSEQEPGDLAAFDAGELIPSGAWTDHPLGVLAELQREGVPIGLHLAIASDIATGAGLSSSAALGVATALATLAVVDLEMSALDVARLCRRAENNFLRVPSGLMDQVATLLGADSAALLFDAGAEVVEPVPLPSSFAWLVIASGIERSLRGSDYVDRPAEAEAALQEARARRRGLLSLCDLDVADVHALALPEPLDRRARHIAGECQRVRMAVACIDAANLDALGELMLTSHKSLARDCEVSLPELDAIVEIAMEAGCAGARLMGGGFGGSVLGLVDAGDAAAVEARIRERVRPGAAAARRGGGEVQRLAVVDGASTSAP